MSEGELPVVITAIANAQVEGFVAGTLFAQGWSIIYRALDFDSLEKYLVLNSSTAKASLLIFSPDLTGIDNLKMQDLLVSVKQSIGFAKNLEENTGFSNLHEIPKNPTDLITLVRSFIRAPMLRTNTGHERVGRKSHVIAIGSAGSNTGCTTIALNLAMELSICEKSTLLIDANFRAPSVAALLAMRNIKSEEGWRNIAPQLSIAEITQDGATEIENLMEKFGAEFDHVVIDIGSISGLSNRLTDRRWTSTMTTWSCDFADDLMIVARPDLLGAHRLTQVTSLIEKTSIRSPLSFLLNMRSSGRKGENEEKHFLEAVTPLRPRSVRTIARDPRSVIAAEDEHSTLVEVNERGAMRKSIAKIASELHR